MTKRPHQLFWKWFPYVLVVLIGIFFHFYNFSKASFFYADQGNDLLIAKAILEEGHRPFAGPLLSARGIFIPPTYYYMLAAFLAVGKTPFGTALMFAVFNLITMVGLMMAAEKLVDRKTGVIAGLLFSITVVVQEHGRYMWQPHPVLWFATGMLVCFLLAREQKKIAWLILGTLSYVLAVSVYPSAILLVSYVWYQTIRLYRFITKESVGAALKFTLVSHIALGALIYAPFFVFEFTHGFPTYHALFSASFGPPLSIGETVSMYTQNFLTFAESVANQAYILRSNSAPLTTALFVGVFMVWGWLRRAGAMKQEWVEFLGLPWVFFGWLGVLFYRLEIFHWRSFYLLPLWILLFSIVIRVGMTKRQFAVACVVGVLVFFYTLGNLLRFYRWELLQPLNRLDYYASAARAIEDSMQKNGYDPQDVAVVVFTPDDEQTSWEATPVLYFLHEDTGLPVSLVADGNNIDTRSAVSSPTPAKYLMCSEYPSIEKIQSGCVAAFLKVNTGYVQKDSWLFDDNAMIFLYVALPPV
ncbi:MAG: glycosyltransferase family 39 protein [Candidatus Gottesmanbacteria bacterium]|nr:glycosyltransferase family 39 protein [Candidatus Gottesmanbacteria bacterium]